MVFEIVTENYNIFLILFGFFGVLLGINRIRKDDDDESKLLQGIGIFVGIFLLALPILMVIDIQTDGVYSNYTLLLMILYGIALNARPLKKIPLVLLLVLILSLAGFLVVAFVNEKTDGQGDLPITLFVIILLVVIVVVSVAMFFVEKSIDTFLMLLGWGPVILILGIISLIQGILIISGATNHYGILYFLGLGR